MNVIERVGSNLAKLLGQDPDDLVRATDAQLIS
jgi:hypothetical protein